MISTRMRWVPLALVLVPFWAGAQEPVAGRLVRESYAPQPPARTFRLDLTRFAGAEVPEGAGAIELSVPDVVFDGDASPVPAITEALRRDISRKGGPKPTVAEVFALMHAAEGRFAAAGYVLTRLAIPPQEIAPGQPLTIRIVSGRIEAVDVTGVPAVLREAVQARLGGLAGRPGIRKQEIERALLNAGDLAGLTLRSTHAPGAGPGGIRLVVDGDFRRYAARAGIDNAASTAVGGGSLNLSVAVNSPTGSGEQAYLAYQGGPDSPFRSDPRMTVLAGGLIVPLGNDGLVLSPEVIWSRIEPEEEAGVPKTENRMVRASLRTAYPLIRTSTATLTATGAFDYISQTVEATRFGVALSDDSYGAVRLGLDWQSALSPDSSLGAAVRFSRGIGGLPSAFGNEGAPPTHAGASDRFSKLNASVSAAANWGRLSARLNVQGQTSFGEPLFNSEQFGIDGADSLSALDPGSLSVDEGATARGELGTQTVFGGPLPMLAEPYVFGAVGLGETHNATAVEASHVRAAAAGAGVRMTFSPQWADHQTLSLNMEIGHRWVDETSLTENTRFNIGFGWQF